MFRRLLIGLIFVLGFAGSAQADDAAIRDVIASQVDAFQRDDFEEAFTYASPMIQGVFGSPARFGQMVQQGYPMIYRPTGLSFGGLQERGGRTFQNVFFQDARGRGHVAEYEMIEQGGTWLINGVRLVDGGGLAA